MYYILYVTLAYTLGIAGFLYDGQLMIYISIGTPLKRKVGLELVFVELPHGSLPS